eukprot:1119775-Rhodomonas_salina.1
MGLWLRVSSTTPTVLPTPDPLLTYAMSASATVVAPMPNRSSSYAICAPVRCAVLTYSTPDAISAPDTAHADICVRVCYAMSGTELAHAATRHPTADLLYVLRKLCPPVLSPYTLPMRCAVLTYHTLLAAYTLAVLG